MDLQALLAPIDGDAPCGDDLSFSPVFDRIQELRRADDPTLDQGDWVTALKAADWPAVRTACEQVLRTRSKDLRVAGWLTDAEARLEGYGGLADGLVLCRELCARHWDGLHPQVEDGDLEQRSGNLRWLLMQVQVLALRLPVMHHGGQVWTLDDVAAAGISPATRGAERPATDPRATPTRPGAEDLAAARRASPPGALGAQAESARRALDALAGLQTVIDARMGEHGPGFTAARDALEAAVHAAGRLAGDGRSVVFAEAASTKTGAGGGHAGGPAAAGVRPDGSGLNAAGDGAGSAVVGGPPRTREEALRQLRDVAEFFRRTEPHSPVAYLADRAAQWGDMPLHDWLRAVVKDTGVLSNIEELLGVPAPKDPG